jgi:hypothetical protein
MAAISEHAELLGYLRGKFGQDLLAAIPLVSSHIGTTTVLDILRAACSSFTPEIAKVVGRRVSLVAFGSIGRREYVPRSSDLDALIVIEGTATPDVVAATRSTILTPLARMSPWLAFDHREHVISDNWSVINTVDISYPVIGSDELIAADVSELTRQRQWQLLFEGRYLLDEDFFDELYDYLLPRIDKGDHDEIDFQHLATADVTFFGGFDSPLFLYKSPFKYFKTRFLRDFFTFGSQLELLLGYYQQQHGEQLHRKYIRAATVNKMMRSLRFAEELERVCCKNKGLSDYFETAIDATLKAHSITRAALLQFGATEYESSPARLLHGLLMSVLARFSACWEQIYNPHVRLVLSELPKTVNLESPFPQNISGARERAVVTELQQRRDSYRRYMSATAVVLRDVFPRGRTWALATVPQWVEEALTPFIRV